MVHWVGVLSRAGFSRFGTSVINFAEIQMRAGVLPDPAVASDLWKAAALSYASTVDGRGFPFAGFPAMPKPSSPVYRRLPYKLPPLRMAFPKRLLKPPTAPIFCAWAHPLASQLSAKTVLRMLPS